MAVFLLLKSFFIFLIMGFITLIYAQKLATLFILEVPDFQSENNKIPSSPFPAIQKQCGAAFQCLKYWKRLNPKNVQTEKLPLFLRGMRLQQSLSLSSRSIEYFLLQDSAQALQLFFEINPKPKGPLFNIILEKSVITLFFHIYSLFCQLQFFDCLSQTLEQITIIILMIVSHRAKIACNLQRYLSRATRKSLLSHFSFAFSNLKQKADLFICSATTILTLKYDTPNSLVDENTSQSDSEIAKAYMDDKKPFSFRDKIVHNISQLSLNQSSNRQQILQLFRIDHGLRIKNYQIQTRIKEGSWVKTINNQLQNYFVFNPTSVFKQLLSVFKTDYSQRKILTGNYGIGKSSNQLLANILTTHLFNFRKEGKQAEKDLKEIILKNTNLLKSIMHLTEHQLQHLKDENQFFEFMKYQLFGIPFILYYSFPQAGRNQVLSELGFTQVDFKKYLSQKEINKLPKKTNQAFCKQIERICNEHSIRMGLVIDQSNFYFSTLRKLQSIQQVIRNFLIQSTNPKLKDEKQEQAVILIKNAKIYGRFLDKVARIFDTYPNITLSCSENVEYPFQSPKLFGQNLFQRYSSYFFSKQASQQSFRISYGRNQWNKDWQKDIDLVFWFELESTLHNLLFIQEKTKKNKISSKAEILNYLKYYYFRLIFQGELKTQYFWPTAARHMLIHKCIKPPNDPLQMNEQAIDRKIIVQNILQIIVTLSKQKMEMKTQYNQNQQVLEKFKQNIRELRQKVKLSCQKMNIKHLIKFLQKDHTSTIKYLRTLLTLEIYQIVKDLQESQKQNIVITNQQVNKILGRLRCSSLKFELQEIINRSYTIIKKDKNEISLVFNMSLQKLKNYLDAQALKINYEIFFALLMMNKISQLRQKYAEILIIHFLTRKKLNVYIAGNVQDSFNIRNQTSLFYTSFLSFIKKEKYREAKFIKAIDQKSKKTVVKKYGQDAWRFRKYFYEKLTKKRINQIKSSEGQKKNKFYLPQQVIRDWEKYESQKLLTAQTEETKQMEEAKQTGEVAQTGESILAAEIAQADETIQTGEVLQTEKTEEISGTLEIAWSHILQLFKKQENKGIQNLTFGASPITKESKLKGQGQFVAARNSPYFDLMLIKKNQQKENSKSFKIIAIDVTVGKTESNYSKKLKKFIDFKNYVVMNNLQFFNKIEMEVWILCPQDKAKPNSQRWINDFEKQQEKLDKINESKTDPLVLKIVSFNDIQFIGSDQSYLQNQYRLFISNIRILDKELQNQKLQLPTK